MSLLLLLSRATADEAANVADVLDGFYAHITGDCDFNTSLGGSGSAAGRVWLAQAKRNETMPYAVYGPITQETFDPFDSQGLNIRMGLTVWSDAQSSGGRACQAIADEAAVRIDRQTFTASNHTISTMATGNGQGPMLDGDAWRVDSEYLILAMKS